ncbi:MAG: response regulator [Spartobacteria bacterium]|nr:response regulator [Spartobacteria bacterium]
MAGNNPSLSLRLALAVAITVLAATALYAFSTYYTERAAYMRLLNQRADEYLGALVSQVTYPIYNVNQEAVNIIGSSFVLNELIASVSVKAEKGTIAYSHKNTNMTIAVTRSRDAYFNDELMGTVSIELTAEPYIARINSMFKSLLLNLLITLSVVVFITSFILRTLLKKPLESLHYGVTALANGNEFTTPANTYAEFEPTLMATQLMAQKISQQMTDLQAAKKKYKDIYINSIEGIFQSTLDDRFINVNPALVKMFGFDSKEETLASIKSIKNQVYVNMDDYHSLWKLLKKNGRVSAFETQFRRKNGETMWGSISVYMVRDQHGGILYNEGYVIDISERKQKEQALIEREIALKANEAKSHFLAKISHEIRTPMNAILGMAELLQESSLSEKQHHRLKIIQSSGNHLLKIINDILNYSRLSDSGIELESLPVDLFETVRDCMVMMDIRAQKKGLSLTLDYSAELPHVILGDQLRLRQVFVNLLSNAVKFTEQGGITLKLEAVSRSRLLDCKHTVQLVSDTSPDASFARLTVMDTGIGMAPETIPKIFQQFAQADASITRKYGGTGLGLAISLEIIRHMDGCLWVESELNKGSSFIAVFPLCRVDERLTQRPAVLQVDPLPVTLPPMKILLADDHDINREMIVGFLEKQPVTITEAANGREVVELWLNNSFDVILMDLEMPEMDGVTATKAIRTHEKESNKPITPIYALTAHALTETTENCLSIGMQLVLTKPISKQLLIQSLHKIETTPDHAPHPVNMEHLMRDFADNGELAFKLLRKYHARIPVMLEELSAAIASKDWELVSRIAHRNKGTSANLTAYAVSDAAAMLDTAARRSDERECMRFHNALQKECASFSKFVEQLQGENMQEKI